MTICIAAICENSSVVGASDRMLTAGDIQFQPNSAKIRPLSNSLVAMTAGDASLQREVLDLVEADARSAILGDPETWLTVHYVANLYCEHWAAVRRRRAELAILRPLGLTIDSFLADQGAMNDRFVSDISNAVLGHPVPTTETLIVGVDASGPHIYVIVNGEASCADAVGFASIGSGGRHADSQLMLAQYGRHLSIPEALLLVHSAKSRAEVAPGVGCDTDMFLIGPALGTFLSIGDEAKDVLATQFRLLKSAEAGALHNAKMAMFQYVEDLKERATKRQKQDPTNDPGDDS